MEVLILVVHVIAALGIITLVLVQHGKGADMGAAFGGGSSGSLFGSSGSANFLSRSTSILAAVFFVSSISLTVFSSKKSDQKGVMSQPASSAPASSLPSQIPVPPASVPASNVPVPGPGGAKT
ncbi:MAG: preprotein translocase subunit SecG, partial [Burkholderiales bacterium]